MREEMKKAYQKPDLTLVRFSTEDVLGASQLPNPGAGETPIVVF